MAFRFLGRAAATGMLSSSPHGLGALNARMTILLVSHDIAFISSYVTRVACVNRTLVCHRTDALDGAIIQGLYDESVRRVAHEH